MRTTPYAMSELAEEAGFAVSDLMNEERWERFEALTDVEKIQWRYCHADCDDFASALRAITAWPIVAISDRKRGPLHRLVRAPDGRLLDARGWTSLEALRLRYKLTALPLAQENVASHSPLGTDEDFHPVVSALLQLPLEPFNTEAFQALTRAFAQEIGLTA